MRLHVAPKVFQGDALPQPFAGRSHLCLTWSYFQKELAPCRCSFLQTAFSCPLGSGALDKLYFISRNTELYQLFFDVGIYVPFVRFVCTKIAEHELCTPIVIRAYIVVIDCPRTDRSLVIGIILELATQQAHIKSHFRATLVATSIFALSRLSGCGTSSPKSFHWPLPAKEIKRPIISSCSIVGG